MTTTEKAKVPAARAPENTEAAPESAITIGHGALLRAAQKSIAENSITVEVAGLGTVRLPALDSLAFLGGLAALAAVGLLEWPIVGVLGVGHVLANQHHLRLLEDLGKALQQA
jgi:hypothetical protein